MVKKELIDEALQQMTGFKVGRWGDIRELVSSMGLTKDEWEHIKNKEECGYLDEDDVEEINEIFAEEQEGIKNG